MPRFPTFRVRCSRSARRCRSPRGRCWKKEFPASPRRILAGRAATSNRSRFLPTCCCGSWRWTRDAAETILLRNGELMEASASTVHVVIGGELRTPPNSRKILPGTTRGAVEELAARVGLPYRATAISEAELRRADEIWISAATREVQSVTTLDGKPVGAGRPGALWRRVYDEFQRWKQELQHQPWR